MAHLEYTECWCDPKVENVDGVGIIVRHRNVQEGWLAGRMFYTEDDDHGWRSDQPFIHTYPESD
jgi:hypothetical protein